MNLTVLGANGRVGRIVVVEALGRGYTVRAFIHQHNTLPQHPKLQIIKGDSANSADVARALEDADAVISVLSSWRDPTHQTLQAAMKAIIPSLEVRKGRLVSLTGIDAWNSDDHPGLLNQLSHLAFKMLAAEVLADSEAHIRLLAKSKLSWTVLRSPVMTNASSENYCLHERLPQPVQTISRRAVAHCLLDLAASAEHTRRVVTITKK